jgi:restriction endonuclease S subunit
LTWFWRVSGSRIGGMVEQMPGTESGNESGYVQEGWRVAHLGALGTVRYGLGQPPEQDIDGLPMIRATNIKRGRIVADGLIRIKKSAIPESRDPYLRSGDIIVVRSGAYTGDLAMVTPEWEGCVAGYDLVFSPSNRVDPEFCAFALLSGPIQTYFQSQRDRSAQPHLNRQQLESAGLPLPPLPEQRAIAQILRAVQRAKEATEKVVAATWQLKASMMRHLFTYGPVPVADADQVETRESELGLIPRDWNTGRLRDLATKITKFSFRRFGGRSRAARRVKFPPANRS